MRVSDRNYEDGELLGHSIMDIFTIASSLQVNSSGDRELKIIPSSRGVIVMRYVLLQVQ